MEEEVGRTDDALLSGVGNEKQIAFFGFSGVAFSDRVFNTFVESWEQVCKEKFKTDLKELSDKDKLHFLSMPFTDPRIESMFAAMKKYCVTEIFNIPQSVTLPECREMQIAAAGSSSFKNTVKSEKEIAEKLEKIRVLRIKLAERKEKVAALKRRIEVLHELEKSQELLIKNKKESMDVRDKEVTSPV